MDIIDYGRPQLSLGRWFRLDRRALVVTCMAWVLTLILGIFALFTGDATLSPSETLSALGGNGSAFSTMIVVEWRLPRILMAILLGAALAVSGSIFQTLTNNALGSPDVIGFQTGSFTGALIVMLILRGGSGAVMVGALAGGVLTALAVFALSQRAGHTQGVRLIIVGIGVSALMASINTWILLSATVEDALMAGLWGAGNLSGTTWPQVGLVAGGSVVFFTGAVCLIRPMRVLQIGTPFAIAVGQRVRWVQLAAIVVGIGLIALATSTVGPVAFIALAAPHIARRVAKGEGLVLGPCTGVGALLLMLADVVAQRIYPVSPLPVGIVTVSIGGVYFLWLLLREGKRS